MGLAGLFRYGMRFQVFVIFLFSLTSCSRDSSSQYWHYDITLPPSFIAAGTDIADQRIWESKNGLVTVTSFTFTKPRSEFENLEEFSFWLTGGPDFTTPQFFRASNGLDIAVDTIPKWTQVAISPPDNTEHWQIVLFGISGGDSADPSVRALREVAIGAILGGQFMQHSLD